ncbi:MAG: hypothetical protein ISQ34_05035 [Rickettsiales bacterium]|nr:hypothetical protein [Rickettsiales bacterium]
MSNQQARYAIRFGLGAIKAVGYNMMVTVCKNRKENGNFKDIYDFCERIDPKSVNKKSIEALGKAGAFDSLQKNRRQIAESFDILSAYSTKREEEKNSNQMTLFGAMPEANAKPALKNVEDWDDDERLQKEFEAFGFFLNEHPLDRKLTDLKKRGVIFSPKIEKVELEDGNLIKIAGVVAASKHRSSARGRFAYLTMSDPFGIYEVMIFDEAIITEQRDNLVDGSQIMLNCLVRRDEGGIRILTKEVTKLDDFINNTKAQDKEFEDIKQQTMRNRYNKNHKEQKEEENNPPTPTKKAIKSVNIHIHNRDSIFAVKSLILRFITNSEDNFTKIYLHNNGTKINLPQKFCLDMSDLTKLNKINGIDAE